MEHILNGNKEWARGGRHLVEDEAAVLPVFGVIVSITFVHIMFSAVWVAEWPPFWK